jgi:hypothetical protein
MELMRFPNFVTPTIPVFRRFMFIFIGETVISQSWPQGFPQDDERIGGRLFQLCPFLDEFDYILDVELPDHKGDICCQVCETTMGMNNVGFALSLYGIQC